MSDSKTTHRWARGSGPSSRQGPPVLNALYSVLSPGDLPGFEDHGSRVGVLAAMMLAGAGLGALAVALPEASRVDRQADLAISALGLLAGTGLWLVGRRLPGWALHPLLMAGVVSVSLAVYFGHGGKTAVAAGFLYLWIVSYAAYFFRPVVAAAHVTFFVAAFCTVAGLSDFVAARDPMIVMVVGTAAGSVVVPTTWPAGCAPWR